MASPDKSFVALSVSSLLASLLFPDSSLCPLLSLFFLALSLLPFRAPLLLPTVLSSLVTALYLTLSLLFSNPPPLNLCGVWVLSFLAALSPPRRRSCDGFTSFFGLLFFSLGIGGLSLVTNPALAFYAASLLLLLSGVVPGRREKGE